jgi:hypothetical protein
VSHPLPAGTARKIRATVSALSAADLTAIATVAFAPDGQVARWAEIIFADPSATNGAFAGLREKDDGNGRPGREFTVDAAALRRGLRRAIESAIDLQGLEPERAISGHLTATSDPAVADRVIQFALFESDREVYYTGAGVES